MTIDKRQPLLKDDLLRLSCSAFETNHEIEKKDAHFNAKLCGFDIKLSSLEKELAELAKEYKWMEWRIRSLEQLMSCLRENEKKYFDFIDIDGLKEKQRVRLESIRAFMTVEIPGLDDTPIINYQPQRSEPYEATAAL